MHWNQINFHTSVMPFIRFLLNSLSLYGSCDLSVCCASLWQAWISFLHAKHTRHWNQKLLEPFSRNSDPKKTHWFRTILGLIGPFRNFETLRIFRRQKNFSSPNFFMNFSKILYTNQPPQCSLVSIHSKKFQKQFWNFPLKMAAVSTNYIPKKEHALKSNQFPHLSYAFHTFSIV